MTATAAPCSMAGLKAGSSYSCSTRGGTLLEVAQRSVSLL
jgi:hypothetical protein